MYLFVELHCGGGAEQYAECGGYALSLYAVFLALLYGGEASYGVVYVFVYGAFAAPGGAIDGGGAVGSDAYDGVVVVYECAAGDVFYPQVAMCAFALPALAQEHIGFAVVFYGGRVYEQGVVWCGADGEYEHRAVVESKDLLLVGATSGYGEVLALFVALEEGARYVALGEYEHLVFSALAVVHLECCRGTGKFSHLFALPRGYDAVVDGDSEQWVGNAVGLEGAHRGE